MSPKFVYTCNTECLRAWNVSHQRYWTSIAILWILVILDWDDLVPKESKYMFINFHLVICILFSCLIAIHDMHQYQAVLRFRFFFKVFFFFPFFYPMPIEKNPKPKECINLWQPPPSPHRKKRQKKKKLHSTSPTLFTSVSFRRL